MIKIIQGTFGLKVGNVITPKTSKDEPFSCDEAIEKRLVDTGVAEYVEATEAEAVVEAEEKEALYTDETSLAELKEIAKKLGATEDVLKSIRAKAVAKELIDNLALTYEAESEEIVEVEDEEVPVFNEADGVVQ